MDFYNKIVEFIHSIGNMLSMPTFSADFTAAINYINFVLYFVPVNTFLAIFACYLVINISSFLVRTIRVVMDIVPVV